MKLFDYSGVIHLHSAYSYDGHASLKSIVQDAEACGVDFLMLTDHDHLRARDEGWEGWQGKTLVIVGQEISPRYHHYLAFNIQKPVLFPDDPEGHAPQRYMDEVNRQGGFGFIAHPDHEGAPLFHVKQYCWTDWTVTGYAGIGVWDFMTDWQMSLGNSFKALLSFLFPAYFLKGPRGVTLARWDALSATRKTVGIGELDNHASVKKILGLTFVAFPFRKAFSMMRTHVLTTEPLEGEGEKDIRRIFEALRYGRCYMALACFGDARGFQFAIEQNGQSYFMGDCLTREGGARLLASVPARARIHVIRNGAKWAEAVAECLDVPVSEPGVYRLEVYLKKAGKYRPWIFSNPIFVNGR